MKIQLAALAFALTAATAAEAATPAAHKSQQGPVIGTVSAKSVKIDPTAIMVTANHQKGSEKVHIEMNMFGSTSHTHWSCEDTDLMNTALDLKTPTGFAMRREFVRLAQEEVTKVAGARKINLKVDQSAGPVYDATVRERFIDEAADLTVEKNRAAIRAAAHRCDFK